MIKTNTLIFTNLTPDIFNDNNTVIRDVLQPYSHLERLVAIKSFGRILAVFNDTNVAIQIKTTLHLTKLPGHDFIMGVYYGQHTDLHQLNQENNSNNLRVPELQKNFLISPPGSPAIGWIQTIESDPVSGGITEDICENAMITLDGGLLMDHSNNFGLSGITHFKFEDENNIHISLPSIVVFECEDSDCHQSKHVSIPPTCLPPFHD